MTAIKEYELELGKGLAFEVPAGATILAAGIRGGKPRLWVMGELINEDAARQRRTEVRRVTSAPVGAMWDETKIPGEMRMIGDFLMPGAKPVQWFVFEVVQRIVRVN